MFEAAMLAQKTAVRFTKTGAAIYHSHHDMMRFWERAVKRAGLPMRMTQGFNPHPRLIFPHALGVGIVSLHEEVELELYRRVALREIADVLTAACGSTLAITGAEALPAVKKSRMLVETSYRISGWDAPARDLSGAVADILAMPEILVERGAPKETRRLDIRPYLKRLILDGEDAGVRLVFRHTASGSGRPDEIARLIAGKTGCDAYGVLIEKTGMKLD